MAITATSATEYPRLRYRILTQAVEIDVPDATMRNAVAQVLSHFTPDNAEADAGDAAAERVQYTLIRATSNAGWYRVTDRGLAPIRR